jgi:hypothetical protein
MFLLHASMGASGAMDRNLMAAAAPQCLPPPSRMVDKHDQHRHKRVDGPQTEAHLHGVEHLEGVLAPGVL